MPDEKKRANLVLPDDVFRQAKSEAALAGVSLSEWVTTLITIKLMARDNTR